jgi:squalene-hopene/tetraprenyl-beta-curcumene cyclase
MKLIKALFSRLSDSLLSNGAAKLSPATEFSPAPPLRLVSDKPTVLPPLDAATRRAPTHAVSQPDAIDDAIRRSPRDIGWPNWKPTRP